MKFVNKKTGETIRTKEVSPSYLLRTVYNSIDMIFMLQSETLRATVNKYRKEPLRKYTLTEQEKQDIAKNPDLALDIPRYYVDGFDQEVSKDSFERKIRREFVKRCRGNDMEIARMINIYSKVYIAICID